MIFSQIINLGATDRTYDSSTTESSDVDSNNQTVSYPTDDDEYHFINPNDTIFGVFALIILICGLLLAINGFRLKRKLSKISQDDAVEMQESYQNKLPDESLNLQSVNAQSPSPQSSSPVAKR